MHVLYWVMLPDGNSKLISTGINVLSRNHLVLRKQKIQALDDTETSHLVFRIKFSCSRMSAWNW